MHLLVVQHCGFMPDIDLLQREDPPRRESPPPPQRERFPQTEDDKSPDLENLVCVALQLLEFAVISNLRLLQLALPQARDNPCLDLRMKLPTTGDPFLASTTAMCQLTLIPVKCDFKCDSAARSRGAS